jgi:hypothetical protein
MSNHRQGNARPKFALGRIYATPGALKLLERCQQGAHQLLARHARGDRGLVHPDDAAANEHAVGQGLRIISSYMVGAPDPMRSNHRLIDGAHPLEFTLCDEGDYAG